MSRDAFYENSTIVTGASSGIGRCLALRLAESGAWLTLAARRTTELEGVAALCRQKGAKACAVPTDISDEVQCKTLVERAVDEYGRLDTLINNAGIGMRARFDELEDVALLRRIMEVNFWGSVYCTRYANPLLRATNGRVVAILSGGGLFIAPSSIGYGASKHAMAGFFDTLRYELRGTGVSVTCVYPEWVATGISTRACLADGSPAGELAPQEEGAMSPEDCAQRILKAVARRRRDVITRKERFGLALRSIAPTFVDGIAAKTFEGDVRRVPC